MNRLPNILIIAGRTLSILMAGFMSLFSLDCFDGKSDFWYQLSGFLLSNIPSLILILLFILSFKKVFLSSIMFFITFISLTIFFKTYNRIDIFLLISFPVLVISIFVFWGNYLKYRN